MATKSDKIAVIKQMHPPVEKTDTELQKMTVKELDAIIESKNGVTPAQETAENDVEIPSKSKAKTAVHFKMNDGKIRTFGPKDHGDDFVKVADEFHTTNKARIVSRTDE